MLDHIIKIPNEFTSQDLSSVFNQVKSVRKNLSSKDKNAIIFDISDTKYLSVLAALIIYKLADDFYNSDCICIVRCKEARKSLSFYLLKCIGAIKDKVEKDFQDFIDSNVVQVQRCLNLNDCKEAVDKKIIPLIRNKFKPPDEVLKAINWILWETIDNAIVHGYLHEGKEDNFPNPILACAYAFDFLIDIAILDTGQGIRSSFVNSGNQKYQGIDDEKALKLAITKGESGRRGGSTGYGLFGCSQIAKQTDGELSILSGEKRLYLNEKGCTISPSVKLNGTLVQLSIPRNVNMNLGNILGQDIDLTPGDFGWLTGTIA